MQPLMSGDSSFSQDQKLAYTVEFWDSPFPVSDNDHGSAGLVLDLRQPKSDGTFVYSGTSVHLRTALQSASAGTVYGIYTSSNYSAAVITGGRTGPVVGYWSGGAPGQHGAQYYGQVAYHFRGYWRAGADRAWFSPYDSPTFRFAVAGNGWVRITKTVNGATTDVFDGAGASVHGQYVTEERFIDTLLPDDTSAYTQMGGYQLSAAISDLVPNRDYVDIYYLEDGEQWGGFVVKAITGTPTVAALRDAPVVGPSLFDATTSAVAKQTLSVVGSVQVQQQLGQASRATISLPLLRTVNDGFGWTWERATTSDPGYLRQHNGLGGTLDLKRQRLIRVKGGFVGFQYTLFTGFVDDFELDTSGGNVQVVCLGFEQRMLEQFVKNSPDPVSYMTFGYRSRKYSATPAEPVYEVPAYDNWPIEYAVRDLCLRAGSDEARFLQPLSRPAASPVRIVVARKASAGTDTALARFQGLGYSVTENLSATLADCRAYDIVVINSDAWSVSEHNTFIQQLLADGQRVLMDGNDTSTGTFFVTSGSGPATVGTAQKCADDPVWAGVTTLANDTDSGYHITGLVSYATKVGNYTTDSNGCSVVRITDASGGMGLFVPRFSLTGNDTNTFLVNAVTSLTNGTNVVYGGQTYRKARVRSLAGNFIRLDRPTHYGNYGRAYNPNIDPDDEYMFRPENTREIWQRARELTDKYGYDLRFDEFGDLVLRSRNNPQAVVDITSIGSAGKAPTAWAGSYRTVTGTVTTQVFKLTAARIDISVPRGAGYGSWAYTVKRAGVTKSSGVITADDGAGAPDRFYHDGTLTTDGVNATVTTLYSGPYDSYTVELSSSGGDGSTVRRIDCFLLYHTDPAKPLLTGLATDTNALKVSTRASMEDMRNFVTVVGRRVATVTDSTKLDTSPNNPSEEFIVSRAVDVGSITDPSATNYIGFVKESIIYDSDITDNEFADYLARTFIYRQRSPRPNAPVEHTILPVIELRDPVYAQEVGFGTMPTGIVLYVTSVEHRFSDGQAITSLETTSYPEFPSFEPRDDIDVDTDYEGNFVANIEVSYKALDGAATKRLNLGTGAAYTLSPGTPYTGNGNLVETVVAVTAGSPAYLNMAGKPWPPLPGTVQVRPATLSPPVSDAPWPDTSIILPTAPGHKVIVDVQGLSRISGIYNSGSYTDSYFKIHENSGTFQGMDWPNDIVMSSMSDSGRSGYLSAGDHGGSSWTMDWTYEWDSLTGLFTIVCTGASSDDNGGSFAGAKVRFLAQVLPVTVSADFVANTPYLHATEVDYRDGNRRIYLPWNTGDQTSGYSGLTNVTALAVRYRCLGPVDGGGTFSMPSLYSTGVPFYDPYTSEVGNLVSVKFDTLVSAQYRVSIRAVTTATVTVMGPGGTPVTINGLNASADCPIVAWLTATDADPANQEAHWQFFPAGSGRALYWDGVDQVGTWNRQQSESYADAARGAFEQYERPTIGKGFYAWNELRRSGASGPVALISGERDATTGRPTFGTGNFAVWYVHFEVRYDGWSSPLCPLERTIRTDDLDRVTYYGPVTLQHSVTYNPASSSTRRALIYTHLPNPTVVTVTPADYSTANYTEGQPDSTGTWNAYADASGTLCNAKPVRFRFAVQQRPGALWVGKASEAAVRLTRCVHLKAHIFDLVAVSEGTNYGNSTVENRRIIARRVANDSHSVEFKDDTWRKGTSFRATNDDTGFQWVFLPKHFKKDFRGAGEESIVFGDYLQLGEDLPYWDPSRPLAGRRSRYILGFVNYLFYLSAYTQDRSGRFVWCENRAFLDSSKIVKNAYGDWLNPANPDAWATSSTYVSEPVADPTTQFRRFIVTRQWTGETAWETAQRTTYNLGTGTVGDLLLSHKWVDHDPNATQLDGTNWSTLSCPEDVYTHNMQSNGKLPSEYGTSLCLNRQLGAFGSTKLGYWTWEGASNLSTWVPCLTRDFHGYFMLPPMPGKSDGITNQYRQVDVTPYKSDNNTGDDVAAKETWDSYIYDFSGGTAGFWPGQSVVSAWPRDQGVNNIPNGVLDYQRTDEMMHYEDVRGVFSRGPRPGESPLKVQPAGAYYVNAYKYSSIDTVAARNNNEYPAYKATVTGWFDMRFRTEYVWESATLFPATASGRHTPSAANITVTRFQFRPDWPIQFDGGAWAGWKDDVVTNGIDANYHLYFTRNGSAYTNVFLQQYMPLAVGPELRDMRDPSTAAKVLTKQMYFHLVLLNARRETPLNV